MTFVYNPFSPHKMFFAEHARNIQTVYVYIYTYVYITHTHTHTHRLFDFIPFKISFRFDLRRIVEILSHELHSDATAIGNGV
jgi:hypothetical protein